MRKTRGWRSTAVWLKGDTVTSEHGNWKLQLVEDARTIRNELRARVKSLILGEYQPQFGYDAETRGTIQLPGKWRRVAP